MNWQYRMYLLGALCTGLSGCSTTRVVDCASTTTTITCTSAQWMDYAKRQKAQEFGQKSISAGSLYTMPRRKK